MIPLRLTDPNPLAITPVEWLEIQSVDILTTTGRTFPLTLLEGQEFVVDRYGEAHVTAIEK